MKDFKYILIILNESKQFVLPDEYSMTKNLLWEDGVVGEDGVNSTIEDLLKWDRALYTNKLVPKDAIRQIFTPGKVEEGETDYGFGWHIKTIGSYGRIAYHSGGWPGYMAYIERHLDNDKTIIILRNKFTPATKIPLDKIREILYSNL
jgi:CubicO group peptidase (beta-lactamase class C family)